MAGEHRHVAMSAEEGEDVVPLSQGRLFEFPEQVFQGGEFAPTLVEVNLKWLKTLHY